jgi:hypothetical protein
MQRIRHAHVVDEGALAGQQPIVLAPRDCLSDAELHRHPSCHAGSSSLSPRPRQSNIRLAGDRGFGHSRPQNNDRVRDMSTISLARARALVLRLLPFALLLTAGCSIIIVEPKDQSVKVPGSVASEITLPLMYKANTFSARLNDRDVTSSYTVDTTAGKATGTLTGLTAAPYVLDVGACWGIDILFVQQSQYPTTGCSAARAAFSVVQPRLTLTVTPTTLTAPDTLNATVQASPTPATGITVTLASTNAAVATVPISVALTANSPSSTFTVSSVGAGTATINASAPGYTGDSAMLTVKPRLTQFAPASASAGTVLTATGAGFTTPLTVRFGTTQAAAPTNVTATRFNVTVPNVAAGVSQVTVTSNGQTSTPLAFTVTAPTPMTTAHAIFRSTADRIETITFAQATPFANSTFAAPTAITVSTSTGTQNVALCRSGTTLARASSNAVELFTIGGTVTAPTITAGARTPLPSGLTGVGSDCVFVPGALVRATDLGLEAIDTATTPLARLGGNNSGGITSVGVAVANDGTKVFRSHTTGIEVYSLASPSAPTLQSNTIANMSGSATGTALAWLAPGATLARATSAGIDLVSVTGTPSRLGANNTGRQSSNGGVDVAIAGTRVVRATDEGIEVYDVSNTMAPQRCFFRNGDPSATGVGLVISGTVAFRASDERIEAYDLSGVLTAACPATANNTAIPAPIQQTVQPATTGVALIGF